MAGWLGIQNIFCRKEINKAGRDQLNLWMGNGSSVRQLAEEMIKSLIIQPGSADRVSRKEEIEKEIERLGMEKTDFDKNITTAYDVGLMWRKI